MKIFDPSPEIRLQPPRRRRTVIAAVIGVAVCLGLAAGLFHQHDVYATQLANDRHELAASQAEVQRLRTKLASTKGKLDAATLNAGTCVKSLGAETSKVAAFAKQAAACELIRGKLHLKG